MPDTLIYMGFSKDTKIEEACKRFQDRYGAYPEKTFVQGQLLFVGPIPKNEETSHASA